MGAFRSQANALVRKSAKYQIRHVGDNICLLSAPIFFCLILFILQALIDSIFLSGEDFKCGCQCTQCCYTGNEDVMGRPFYYLDNPTQNLTMTEAALNDNKAKCVNPLRTEYGTCPDNRGYACLQKNSSACGVQYSTAVQAQWCQITIPNNYPPLLTAPEMKERYQANSPATTILVTSESPSMTQAYSRQLFNQLDLTGAAQIMSDALGNSRSINGYTLAKLGFQFGTAEEQLPTYYVETAFLQYNTTYVLLPNGTCEARGMNQSAPITIAEFVSKYATGTDAAWIAVFEGLYVTCTDNVAQNMVSQKEVDSALRCGYYQSRCDGLSANNKYIGAWDFVNSGASRLNVNLQYNTTGLASQGQPNPLLRIPSMLTQAAKAWWRDTSGSSDATPPISLLGVQSMPKLPTTLNLDFASLLGPLFFTWVVQLLFPTILTQLVYEKEKRIRMMMKMHGLGDAAYWVVTYCWYLALYCVYIAIFIIFGYVINLKVFRKTSIGIQIIFYFLHGNCMIAFAFLLSSLFASSRTASICAFLYVFITGLIGAQLLDVFIDASAPWLFFIQWVPALSLYRGLKEMASYGFLGVYRGQTGMQFRNLGDSGNGMAATWGIFAVEWVLFLLLGWYLEQIISSGNGMSRHPLFFLDRCMTKKADDVDADYKKENRLMELGAIDVKTHSTATSSSTIAHDVQMEELRALEGSDLSDCPVVVRELRKVFRGTDGRKKKVAVQSLSMCINKGEVMGLLGPNGAGKTTALSMLVGFVEPTSGTAIINGMDTRKDMQKIYQSLGVCPQHDLLWDQLTGREHLQFYGRLKGLVGRELEEAVDVCLKSVNLFSAEVAKKQSSKFSGGMKRRLSVAISFIGEPKVVLLDEPSTGLDPNSRRSLWDVVKMNKENSAIILTTHSMEEAEALCDRLGIFVDGQLVCIGNPKEITSRYGDYLVFQISVPVSEQEETKKMVVIMCHSAVLTYSCNGTLKYELPTSDISPSAVFVAMKEAKSRLTVLDWGVANATLEEVFIKFARSINAQGGGDA